MLVTLLEDVKALGHEGQVVEVPEGYATNFLFPQHVAVIEVAKPRAEPALKAPTKEELAEEQLAAAIDGQEIVISMASVRGRPKSAVTATEIRKGLKDLGYSVEKSAIKTEPITSFGSVDVPVEFSSGFEATIRVSVEPT